MFTDPGESANRTVDEVKNQIREQALEHAEFFPEMYRAYQDYLAASTTAEGLLAGQASSLRRLLDTIAAQVPFYRRLGLKAGSGDDPFDVLAQLPLVTKEQLRADLLDHCADDIDPTECQAAFTSGTSGIPLRMILSREHLVHSYATALVRNYQLGVTFHRKILQPYQIWLPDWFEYTVPNIGLARMGMFGAAAAESDPAGLAERIVWFEPDVVFAHPSSCGKLADLLERHDRRIQPALVFTFGERLEPAQRRRLSAAFGCRVHDLYGMREVSTIAGECSAGRYHIESERLWVEVVDDAGRAVPDGVTGEIVVTNLKNKAMAFVRYRTGDLGALSSRACECGAPHKVLDLVEGRVDIPLTLPNGGSIDVLPLVRIIRRGPFERFQIVQRAVGEVDVLVRPTPDFHESAATVVRESLEQVLPGIRVTVRPAHEEEFVITRGRKLTDFVPL